MTGGAAEGPGRAAPRRTWRWWVALIFSRLMRTPFAQRFISPHFAPLQQRLYRLTRGRFQISALLAPTIILHTVGAKSGLARETPLLTWPEPDGSFLVAGSNWGKPAHPAWTHNLIAHPDVDVVYRRGVVPMRAEQITDTAEREQVWPVLEAQFPTYRQYENTAGRQVRIFRLRAR